MAKRTDTKAPAEKATTLAALGLENFVLVEVNRQQIKNAEYNPRVMSDEEKRKLRAGIKKHGMVVPIVWNKTTGNCVGGHQRLSQLDALAGTKNYTLHVAQIAVPLNKEKEINVLLNNPHAQGAWDLVKLSALVTDKTLDIEGMGFERVDIYRLLGEDFEAQEDAAALAEMADKARAAVERFRAIDQAAAKKYGVEFYLVVVFRDEDDRAQFLADAGLEDNRYQSGETFKKLCIRTEAPKSDKPSPKTKPSPTRSKQ